MYSSPIDVDTDTSPELAFVPLELAVPVLASIPPLPALSIARHDGDTGAGPPVADLLPVESIGSRGGLASARPSADDAEDASSVARPSTESVLGSSGVVGNGCELIGRR